MSVRSLMDEVSHVATQLRVEAALTDDPRAQSALRMAHAIALSLLDEMERAERLSAPTLAERDTSRAKRDAA